MGNDYAFGNTLTRLRTARGLTQAELAAKLGVTDKAVSKWENGRAKPGLDTLRRLAALYDLPVGELLELRERAPAGEIPARENPPR